MSTETCGEHYERHPSRPELCAVCTRPKGHDGEHSNVLHKPHLDPDRQAAPR